MVLALAYAGANSPALAEENDAPSLFGIDLGIDTPIFRVGTDVALFERPRYGGDSRLIVRDDGRRWRVYRGPGYTEIVKKHPALRTHAGLEVLGQRVGADVKVGSVESRRIVPGATTYVQVPRFTYVVDGNDSLARLYVQEGDAEYVYVGSDLNTIVTTHPQVRKVDGFATLEKRVAVVQPVHFTRVEASPNAVPYQVEYWYMPDQVVIRTWQYQDGSWSSAEYRGATLAEARASLQAADATLASQLELRAEETREIGGAVICMRPHSDGDSVIHRIRIRSVAENSAAARLGMRAGDFLVSIDGKMVADLDSASKAWTEQPREVTVLRGSERVTLKLAS
jgi:hypothetical protein